MIHNVYYPCWLACLKFPIHTESLLEGKMQASTMEPDPPLILFYKEWFMDDVIMNKYFWSWIVFYGIAYYSLQYFYYYIWYPTVFQWMIPSISTYLQNKKDIIKPTIPFNICAEESNRVFSWIHAFICCCGSLYFIIKYDQFTIDVLHNSIRYRSSELQCYLMDGTIAYLCWDTYYLYCYNPSRYERILFTVHHIMNIIAFGAFRHSKMGSPIANYMIFTSEISTVILNIVRVMRDIWPHLDKMVKLNGIDKIKGLELMKQENMLFKIIFGLYRFLQILFALVFLYCRGFEWNYRLLRIIWYNAWLENTENKTEPFNVLAVLGVSGLAVTLMSQIWNWRIVKMFYYIISGKSRDAEGQ